MDAAAHHRYGLGDKEKMTVSIRCPSVKWGTMKFSLQGHGQTKETEDIEASSPQSGSNRRLDKGLLYLGNAFVHFKDVYPALNTTGVGG